ncbi:hypothetical protein BDY21DRAFT_276974 [Lineolata rhizophorae]|uniref:Phosphoinositide phospholipase C n=1 Tax=Lineolata rhizophorae TaxID=578093 RepID=A0A6A6PE12_9PEZI|nr:hypothetical protein BDY21DRAFT_276974 [Lineolata rhizophorae]
MPPTSSVQNTPDALQPVACPSPFPSAPLSLPESAGFSPLSPPSSAMAEAVNISRSPRELSRKLSERIPGIRRRRQSATHSSRDLSCGPVTVRRRSDSKSVTENAENISDLELEEREDDGADDFSGETAARPEFINALGITTGRPSVGSATEGGVAPLRNRILQEGTRLSKITRKKRKDIPFKLDFDSAKIIWDPTRPSKQVYVDDIRGIRYGEEAKNYREEHRKFISTPEEERRWFTLLYGDPARRTGVSIKTMHLIAPDDYTFHIWITNLDHTIKSRCEMMTGLMGSDEKSVKAYWRREMERKFGGAEHSDEDEKVDFADMKKICRILHIHCSEATLREQFDAVDSERTGYFTFPQFEKFMQRIRERQDIKKIYQTWKHGKEPELDLRSFLFFLAEAQGIRVAADEGYWINVFEKYSRNYRARDAAAQVGGEDREPTMSFAAFQAYLCSSANSALVTSPSEPNLDLPLNDYFISSSHNTYLVGRQVAGEASTEMYISALQKGCRCVEVDCWDGDNGQPIVTHGHTRTKSVPFVDVIEVIDKYAFVSTNTPLIVSLEVHCNSEQQAIMADIMKKIFGVRLQTEQIEKDAVFLPTPRQLMGKILIKVKAPEASTTESSNAALDTETTYARRQRTFSSPPAKPLTLGNSVIPSQESLASSPPPLSPPECGPGAFSGPGTRGSTTSGTGASPNSSSEDSDASGASSVGYSEKKKKQKSSKITKALGDLGVYARGIKYTGHGFTSDTFNHVYSFSENKFDDEAQKNAELVESHNRRYLMRIYPSPLRFSSKNFDPIRFWRRGVQMVATNWQTYDLGTQINDAMFAAPADRCGYVLKPPELRLFKPPGFAEEAKSQRKLVRFTMDIISAQQLPRPRGFGQDAVMNPYIEFEVYGADDKGDGDATSEGGIDASLKRGDKSNVSTLLLRKQTRIVRANGYDPQFDESITVEVKTKYPSLVFVRWVVWNSADGKAANGASLSSSSGVPLATFTAKLGSLQQGYRHLPLYDSSGEQYLFSSLFCKIAAEDQVPVDEEVEHATLMARSVSQSGGEVPSSSRRGFRKIFGRTPSIRGRARENSAAATATATATAAAPPEGPPFSRSSTLERQ